MNDISADKTKRILAISKLILLLIIIAGIPAFLYFRFGSEIFSADAASRLVAYLEAHEQTAALLFIGIQVLQVVVCILPGQPIQFAASYMFGVFGGLILSLIGAVIGVVISFYLARLLGRDAIRMLFGGEKVEDYQQKLNSGKGLSIALLIYLIPGVPKDLVSYVAGISEMKFIPFLTVATIGRIPGMAGSLLIGHFFRQRNYNVIAILCVVVAVILAICAVRRKAIFAMLDRLGGAVEEMEAEADG